VTIHYQDLSRCVVSTKNLKSSFGASTVWSKELLDRVWTKSRRWEDFKWRLPADDDLYLGLFYKILFLVKSKG